MTDYLAIAASNYEKIDELAALPDSEWKEDKDKKGAKIWHRKSTEFDGRVVKSQYEVETTPENIRDLIMNPEKRLKWDHHNTKDFALVEQINEDLGIYHTLSPSMMGGIVSSRDVCDVIAYRSFPDKNLLRGAWSSVHHRKCPEVKGSVRAHYYASGNYLQGIEGGKTLVTDIIQFDGHLTPKSVAEKFLPGAMMDYIKDMRKGAKEFA
ncbi:stAR-related lipid transfer protein 5-like [Glandiceps talaboti]